MSVLKSTLVGTFHDRISRPALGASGALARLNRAGRGFGATQARIGAPMMGMTRNLIAMGAAYIGVRKGFDVTAGGAMRLETVMADVAKKTTLTAFELEGVEGNIKKLSNLRGGMAMTELGKLYAQAGQFGIANNELERFVKLGNKAGIAFDMTATDTANSLSKLKNAFGLDMPGLAGLADSINFTADSAGTSEKSLIDFLLRTAAAAKTFGISGQEMSAFGATLNEIGIESSKAGTGMNAMMAKLSGLTKSKKAVAALDRFAGKGYSKELQARFYKTPVDAMKEFFQVVKKMDAQSRTGLLIDFFGLEYQDDAAAIANNIDKIVGRLDKLGDASQFAGSVDKTFEIFANTSEEKLKRLGRVFSNMGNMFGAKILPPLTDFAEKVSDTFATLESRVTVFDTLQAKAQGFVTGLGFSGDNNISDAFNSLWDSTFGRADELASDVEKMGASFEKFRVMGAHLRSFGVDVAWAVEKVESFFGMDHGAIGVFATDMAGWGVTIGVSAIGFALVAGPLKALGKAALFLTGIKPAWALLRFLTKLGGLGGKATGIAALAGAATAVGNAAKAKKTPATAKTAKTGPTKNPHGFGTVNRKSGSHGTVSQSNIRNMGARLGKAQAKAPDFSGAKVGAGRMAIGLLGVLDILSMSQEETTAAINSNIARSQNLNTWLEQNIGSPSSWFGTTKPEPERPIQGPPTRPDQVTRQVDQVETEERFNPMKGFNVLGDFERRVGGQNRETGTERQRGSNPNTSPNADRGRTGEVKILGTPPVTFSGAPQVTAVPSGVQEVRVTNPNPPQINVSVSMTVNEATNGAALAQDFSNNISDAMAGIQADLEQAGQ